MANARKRKFSRIDYSQEASIKFPDSDYEECLIRDVNLTGMFVLGTFGRQIGDKCIIKYTHTSATSHFSFKAAAKIVRAARDGIGILFTSMPLYSYMFLETTLLYETKEPLTLGHQLPDTQPFVIIDELSDEPDENV